MALWMPIYYFQKINGSTAVITSIVIQVVVSLLLLPIWSWFQIQDNLCTLANFDLLNEQLSSVLLPVYIFGLSMALPVVCLFTCNALVIYKLRNKMSVMSERDREISVSLVLVSAAFAVNMGIAFTSVHFQYNSTAVSASTKYLFGEIRVGLF